MPNITAGNTNETATENHFAPLNAPIIMPASTAQVMVPRNVKRKLRRTTKQTIAPQAARYPPAVLMAVAFICFDRIA